MSKFFSVTKILLFAVLAALILGGCRNNNSEGSNVNRSNENSSSNNSSSNNSSESNTSPDSYCELAYQEVLEKHQQDYVSCLSDLKVGLRDCPKPEGFDDGYKENLNVVIALDASGSMNGRISGRQKLEIAKEAITSFVNTLPERANVGLVVYGHKGSNSPGDKQVSCAGVEPVYAVQKLNKPEFLRAVNSFEPTGWTPVAGAINKAAEILKDQSGETATNLVYVVSDGIETCEGKPIEAATNLRQSGAKAIVNIIGFDVGNAAQQQLKQTAEAGGGKYFDAKNADELNRVFGGVSKSVAEYNQYLRCMTANLQDVSRLYQNKRSEISVCIGRLENRESNAIFLEHLKWSREKDPRSKCTPYVIEHQNAKTKRIKLWSDEITNKLKTEQNIKYEQLERELKEVTESRATPKTE